MVPRRKRIYTEEFRAEAIALTLRPGATVTGVARDLGVNVSLLHNWLKKAREGGKVVVPPRNETEAQEVARLRRELDRVTAERDFLKKVSAFFAKEIQ
jgi:transposase